MAKFSKETKQRLQQVFQCGQFVIRWGFIPTVLYLGANHGFYTIMANKKQFTAEGVTDFRITCFPKAQAGLHTNGNKRVTLNPWLQTRCRPWNARAYCSKFALGMN